MIDDSNARKEDLMMALIGDLIENAELAKLNREIRQRMSQGKPITDLAARAKVLQQSANKTAKDGATVKAGEKLLDKLQGRNTSTKKKTPGYGDVPTNSSSRGRDRDPSHKGLGGSVAHHPSSGGENPGTNVGKKYDNKHPHLGHGRSGQYGINNSFELISDLIEANPPKPNAHRVVDKNHQRRTDGMTAYSGVDPEGNIRLKDVFVPKGKDSGKGRALSYVTGLRKYSEKIGKTLSLNAVPGNKPGEREGLDRLYTRAGLVKDPSKPGNTYISKPKNVNKGDKPAMKKSQAINSSYDYELTEKYVKANDPSGKGPDHRKSSTDRSRRKPTPDKYDHSEAEFGSPGKSPSTRRRKDIRRSVVGGKQYNEELIARFRNRIDEAMSPKFSTTTTKKAAERIRAAREKMEAGLKDQSRMVSEPTTVQTKIKPKRKRLDFEVR